MASKGWKVVIAIINMVKGRETAELVKGDFIEADVRSWEARYSAFKMTFDKYGRLDFVFANASLSDRSDPFHPGNDDSDPVQPPDLNSTEVNFIGLTYTALLAVKDFRKNPMVGVDLIMTACGAGLYLTPVMPFYCGGKHGVVGFGRAMGGRLVKEGIRVHVLVPGMVPTTIMIEELLAHMDPALFTSPEHIAAAVVDILEKRISRATCEASVNKLFYRDPPDFLDEAQRKAMGANSCCRLQNSDEGIVACSLRGGRDAILYAGSANRREEEGSSRA
ncbi:hypothetical protein Z517_02508 [Fonsecaea pedrosoi CBS 271.37]|uniref:Uncharacterized protein n=1 Tax=Fonsecaea pedrosoi CBS 271.37 TaxID=1442368 RepID=A0A0D2GQI8_9EURO|nr:uncharacterized protein Z517_02508 [Fonsecaea pedrosoi CBS 271.37]KIW83263.1 hypothetical protein Z517_02508 [Fonsecaea pedrosoi CBS 271.37]